MNNLRRRFIAPDRLRRVGRALLFSLVLAAVCLYVTDRNGTSAIVRGDFPAFWSLAVIADSPEPSKLYDLATQTQIQNEAWPSLKGAVLPAAYPPYLAFMVRPLALCSADTARLIWALCSVALYLVGVRNIARLQPQLAPHVSDCLVTISLFAPVALGILGGQFLAVMIFLVSVVLSSDMKHGLRSDIALGCAVGFLFLKPYYGCAFMASLLVSRRWRAVGMAGVVMCSLWLMGELLLGARWLQDWYQFAVWFSRVNFDGNWYHMPNIHAGLRALGGMLGFPNVHMIGVIAIGAFLLLSSPAFLVPMIRKAWRERKSRDLYIVTVMMIVMGMSQANFYDLGLVVSVAALLFRPARAIDWAFVAMVWLVALLGAVYRVAAGPPYFFVSGLLLSVYIIMRLWGAERRPDDV